MSESESNESRGRRDLPAWSGLFRTAAIEAHQDRTRPGRPIHLVSTWTRWAVNLTLIVVVAGFAFAALAPIGEFAEGTAIVRLEGRSVVTSAVAGTVKRVAVQPGEQVEAGQILVVLDDVAERAELDRIEAEYDQRLVELLRKPADSGRHERLAALDSELRRARAELRARALIAPEPGRVSDLRVSTGQPVQLGDALVSLEHDDAQTVVVGLFPGQYRPMLSAEGTRLFLELEGFPDTYIEVAPRSVADEVVGANEAMRTLGVGHEGALELSGPVVLVETVLPSRSFESEDTHYRVYDGMQGRLEAKLRTATLLETLIPVLRKI